MARVGIIRMNVIWTTKVGDHPENKQVSSVKSAASSPGEIIRECQNRQRNTRNTYRYGPSTRRNRPAIGRRFTTPALTHFPLAAGLDAPPSAKAQESGGLTVGSQRRRRGARSRNQESRIKPPAQKSVLSGRVVLESGDHAPNLEDDSFLCLHQRRRSRPLLVVWGRGRANDEVAEERDGRATNAPTEAIRVRVEIAREGSRSVETSTDCQPNMSIGPSFRQPPPDRGGVHRSVLRLPLPLFKGAHSLLPIPSA
ncbi:hypothetical protein H4582DRAFT_2061267 [Lactarius indigo]|nr:hypothetical protein H4582DRAFT_2061267 [Lactarius indigo]